MSSYYSALIGKLKNSDDFFEEVTDPAKALICLEKAMLYTIGNHSPPLPRITRTILKDPKDSSCTPLL